MRRSFAVLVLLLLCACSDGGGSAPPAPGPPGPSRAAAASTDWWNGAVVYEVFVRSFRDSDGDGKGDLRGLVEKLDHLNDGDDATTTDLGVDAIWLMPVFPSPSSHGYDVTDHASVNPDYGTTTDLANLVAAAHARGMKVVLDWVPNHTGVQHPWFLEAASGPSSAKRDWFVWRPSDPGWQQPWGGGTTWFASPRLDGSWYYAAFWSGMPDLNWRNPAVASAVADAALGWIALGVDGFRLDAVRYLVEDGPGAGQQDRPGTHAALRDFAGRVRAARPGALVVGEAWADAATIATYYGSTAVDPAGDELPLTFDFPLAGAIVSGVRQGQAAPIADALDAAARLYPAGVGDAPFLTNHDQRRIGSELAASPALLRLAASILLTLPGTPFLYYGEEVGMQNGACGTDECKRTPMAWDGTATGGFTSGTPWWPPAPGGAAANVAAQTGDPASILSRYRTLVRLRKAVPALARGGIVRLGVASPAVLAFTRALPGETLVVAHGLARDPVTTATAGISAAALEPVFLDPGAAATTAAGSWQLTVPAWGTAVWRAR